MHILVVEDEKVLCETIVRSLRRLDYSVDSCYDGNEAIELLATESYDLVLLESAGHGRHDCVAQASSNRQRHKSSDSFCT